VIGRMLPYSQKKCFDYLKNYSETENNFIFGRYPPSNLRFADLCEILPLPIYTKNQIPFIKHRKLLKS